MDKTEIEGKLRSFIEQTFPREGAPLQNSTDLLEDWFVDSFGIIETVMFLEQAFAVSVGRADVQAVNFKSIDALTALVLERTATQDATR